MVHNINATRPKENNLCREMSEEIQRAGHFLTKQVFALYQALKYQTDALNWFSYC